MQTAESTNDLIASIYDASLDPTLWPSSLLRISDTLGGSTTGIGVVNAAGQGDIVSIRCAPEALDSFVTYYAGRNPMLQHLPTAELGTPFTDRELMTQAEWQRTEFYNDWGRTTDNHSCLLMPVLRSDNRQGWFAVGRSAKAGDFERRHIELATLLAPHLRRSLEIGKRLDAARVSTASLLEQMNIAAVCLDSTDRIVWNNARAEALIDANDSLRRTPNNKLAAVSYNAAAALQRLLQQARTGTGGMLRLERRSGLPALIAIAVPLRDRAVERPTLPPDAAASTTTVFIVDSASRPLMAEEGIALEGLRALYDLTTMEARVALRLASGTGIPDAARALGVAPSTIRSHAKSLYQKMNLHSQAELASLIERITLFGDAFS
jgi:DNA-binding CsgD family transcriptional regulator